LPLFFPANVNISSGNVKIFLLDVGQGLSALVQTEKHTLLYDTGASFPNGGSLAESVIMPFLKTQSIAKIDTLVLSHGDNDHAGGVAVIAENIPLSFVYRNHEAYPHLAAYPQKVCKKGETWGWDGVQFEFLNPWAENPKLKRNDTSCVLRITIGNINVLLTGDIEKNAEQELIDQDINKLASQILVAPHHGSRTSSSEVFIRAVAPQIVLIPAGYRNRYRLPSKQVLQRYDAKHISYLNTAQTGLIEITIKQDQGNYIISTYRAKHKNYWEYL